MNALTTSAGSFRGSAVGSRGRASRQLKQLEAFARAVHVPFGYLLLPEPPDEQLPIPDFRRRHGDVAPRPSADLLDAIFLCEQRQEWYREFAARTEIEPLSYVGSLSLTDTTEEAARRMRGLLGLTLERRAKYSNWTDALRGMIEEAEAEAAGVLVMVSGVVGSNTHRKLDPDEFGGFTLLDETAPVVFVNGTDTKAAQIFTLAHELAHVWLGQPGVTNAPLSRRPDDRVERWCNAVAAELLVPMASFRSEFQVDVFTMLRVEGARRNRDTSRVVISTTGTSPNRSMIRPRGLSVRP
jgi:Zn-dependent peptidase ImmA (M78 family)